MKSDVETLSPTRVKLTIEVPIEELQPALDKAYQRIAAQVVIPGFRRGKVPARIIDQRVGREVVLEEAANDAVSTTLATALTEHDVRAIGRPSVDITTLDGSSPLQYTAEVDVVPDFELTSYEGIEVTVDSIEVADTDVDEQVDALRARFATVSPVERASGTDDLIVFDMSATSEGEPVEDLEATALSYVLGSDGMIEGFDDAVIGASAGEARTFTFTPQVGTYEGKAIEVTVTVGEVRERILPAADDSFAESASEFDTIEELRDDLRTRIGRVKHLEQSYTARERIAETLFTSVEIPVPDGYVEDQIAEHFAGPDGGGHDDHAHDGGGDHDTGGHRAEVREEVISSLRSQLIFDRIAREQAITVGEAELTSWLISQAPRYSMTPDQLASQLAANGQVQAAIAEVRRSKALAYVLEHAVVTDSDGEVVELRDSRDLLPGPPGDSDDESEPDDSEVPDESEDEES